MDMETAKTVLELGGALVVPIAGIVLGLVSWKQTGKIDLEKTWGHAEDIIHVVAGLIAKGEDPEKAIDKGVDEIQTIRGKKLSKKLRRKAAARIKARLADFVGSSEE